MIGGMKYNGLHVGGSRMKPFFRFDIKFTKIMLKEFGIYTIIYFLAATLMFIASVFDSSFLTILMFFSLLTLISDVEYRYRSICYKLDKLNKKESSK